MKIGLLITSILLALLVHGQKLEKVHSIVKELKSEAWYQEQSNLWKAEIDKNKKNAEAWYNYYSANRALKNISWNDTALVAKYAKVCNQIADAAYKAVPNSFEGNHIVWWNGFNDQSNIKYLKRAYEIDPTNPRAYTDLMLHYIFEQNDSMAKEFAEKLFRANDMPAGAYNWAYNILAEVERNAIIFTAGDNDTFLPWIVQKVFGFRQDVTIMNTSLLRLDEYRNNLFKKIGMPSFSKSIENCKTYQESVNHQKELYAHIFAQEEQFPVYIASTAMHQFQNDYTNNLYLVGLNYKYCDNSFDNIAQIKRNYEKRHQLDYLMHTFS
ncbi:MAG: hypothetical protein R3279_12720, partial [Putridiphycobacter sp.]|nr:hypothetical protein [Putridiphycobacter sp.]